MNKFVAVCGALLLVAITTVFAIQYRQANMVKQGSIELVATAKSSFTPEVKKEMLAMSQFMDGNHSGPAPEMRAFKEAVMKLDMAERKLRKIKKPRGKAKETRFGRVINGRTWWDVSTIEKINAYSPNRYMRVAYLIPRADFRSAKNIPITDDELKITLKPMLADFVKQECKMLRLELADKCAKQSVNANLRTLNSDDGEVEFVRITMKLKFTQKEKLGEVQTETNLNYKRSDITIYPDNTLLFDPHNPQETAEMRLQAYKKMAEKCREMRKTFGNCAIIRGFVDTDNRTLSHAKRIYLESNVFLGVLNNV